MTIPRLIVQIIVYMSPVAALILRFYTKKNWFFFLMVIFIFTAAYCPLIVDGVDRYLHRIPKESIKEKFPSDLDYFSHRVVRFDSGAEFLFSTREIDVLINLTKIYERNEKFIIDLLFAVEDKVNHNSWKWKTDIIELEEGNLVIKQTDRLDFYFFVSKTALGSADIYFGAKTTKRNISFKNTIIEGVDLEFKDGKTIMKA